MTDIELEEARAAGLAKVAKIEAFRQQLLRCMEHQATRPRTYARGEHDDPVVYREFSETKKK